MMLRRHTLKVSIIYSSIAIAILQQKYRCRSKSMMCVLAQIGRCLLSHTSALILTYLTTIHNIVSLGPISCGDNGWYCRIFNDEENGWPSINLPGDVNFGSCNTTDAFSGYGFDQDGHCHGSSYDNTYYWVSLGAEEFYVHIICSCHMFISYVHTIVCSHQVCISSVHIKCAYHMFISYVPIMCAHMCNHNSSYYIIFTLYISISGFVITGIVNIMDVFAVAVDGIKEVASLSHKAAQLIVVITVVQLLKLKMLLNVVMPMKTMGLDSKEWVTLDAILNTRLRSMLQSLRMIRYVGRFSALDILKTQFLYQLRTPRQPMPRLDLPRLLLLLLLQPSLLPQLHLLSLQSPR